MGISFQVLILLLVTIIEIFFLLRAFRTWFFWAQLEQFGVMGQARIAKIGFKRRPYGRGMSYTYYVIYEFDKDGAPHRIEQRISHRNYLRLFPGAPVTISYLQRTPKISRLDGEDLDNTGRNLDTWSALISTIVTIGITASFLRA